MSGALQGLAPFAGGLRSRRTSPLQAVDASLERLSARGFTAFKSLLGARSTIDRFVIGPSGIFLVFCDKQRNFPTNQSTISGGSRFGKKVAVARAEATLVAKNLAISSQVPVVPFVCLAAEAGTTQNLIAGGVRVIAAGDLSAFISAYPAILTPSQVVEVSALAWIRLRRK